MNSNMFSGMFNPNKLMDRFFKKVDNVANKAARKAANMAKLLFYLVVHHGALRLNVLKAIDMASHEELPETALIFLTVFFIVCP